jgi:hydroxymethylpyrimidine/phosphomethylpyrimidine kinase
MSVITALTAQNTQGVQAVQGIPSKFIYSQITSIFDDIRVDAIKIGMLFNVSVVKEVAKCLYDYKGLPIVLDPVMFAKSGDRLMEKTAIEAIKKKLFPLATIVTPNIAEAAALIGRPLHSPREIELATLELSSFVPEAIVVKGGNLRTQRSDDCMVIKGNRLKWLKQKRIPTQNTHGTGCAFSSAIASFLAQSYSIKDSILLAKKYLTEALKAGSNISIGTGKGPIMHFYKMREKQMKKI